MKRRRRRNYLVNRSVQPRHMGMSALFILLISLLTGWSVYSTIFVALTEKISSEPGLDLILVEINEMLLARVSLVILAGMCASVVITMFISHRIAGPIFRIRGALEEMAEGRIPRKITLRKRDEFKELAETVNSLIEKLEDMSVRNKKAKEEINKLLSGSGGENAGEIKAGAEEIGFFVTKESD